jgi:hypothetical protein
MYVRTAYINDRVVKRHGSKNGVMVVLADALLA